MQPKGAPKVTPGDPAPATGREGAIDHALGAANASRAAAPGQMERFSNVLGGAAIALWADLPRSIQEQLFERAVRLGHHEERDEMLREQLAKFLHDRHRRTIGGEPPTNAVDDLP
jgi:hypothetical protein